MLENLNNQISNNGIDKLQLRKSSLESRILKFDELLNLNEKEGLKYFEKIEFYKNAIEELKYGVDNYNEIVEKRANQVKELESELLNPSLSDLKKTEIESNIAKFKRHIKDYQDRLEEVKNEITGIEDSMEPKAIFVQNKYNERLKVIRNNIQDKLDKTNSQIEAAQNK